MKKHFYKIIALLLIVNYQLSTINCKAQNIPSAVNFQAVARNASNQIVANATIEARITITQGNAGPTLRQLTFQKTTDAYGQFTLSLSEGDASSSSGPTPFNNIDWSTGDKWLRVEFRPNLVDAFTLISNSQASASFYAFSARTAEELKTTGANGQVLKHNGTTWVAGTDEGSTFTAPTVQRFTSGSGTYTTPAGVKYITVEMIGGGGGGGGSSQNGTGGTGGTGGTTTFGSSLLTTTGGGGGSGANVATNGGAGGTVTINSPAIQIFSSSGGKGSGGITATIYLTPVASGGMGASSPFSGGGGTGEQLVGGNGNANTGTGGGGGSHNTTINGPNGGGGGAGGYIKAMIVNPNATYSYSVGAGGTGGTAGTSGTAGGAGGSGIIIVTEYYN